MTQALKGLPTRTQRVELILAQLKQLPTLPAVATRLLQMTAGADSDMREVARLIALDPSLSAKILSLIKRASVGFRKDVATVEKAVVLMGFEAVRNAVLTIKVFETFGAGPDQASLVFNRKEFWKHSLAVACASKMLASQLEWSVDPEEAFVCGLLHDMGKVALDACLPKSFDRVVQQCNQRRANIADLEKQLLGVDHAVAGRRLAQLWGLPANIVESIWLHHHPPESLPTALSSPATVRIVHLADLIAREQHVGYSGNHPLPETAREVAARLGVKAAIITQVQQLLAPELEDRAHLIGLDSLTTHTVYLEALSGANEELGRLNATLAASNQTLRLRDRYLEALAQLHASLKTHDTPAKVCRALAGVWRRALTLPTVGVYSRPMSDGLFGYALAGGSGERDDVLAVEEVGDSSGRGIPLRVDRTWTGGPFQPADAVEPAILNLFGPHLGPGPVWLIPLVHEGTEAGGVLFAGDRSLTAGLSVQRAEIEMLAMASALMLSHALSRLQVEQLADELSEANRRLTDAQKALLRERSLAMIAEMAGGAAHELNNPLAVISGRAQLLCESVADEQQKNALEQVRDQAHRCSQIVSELMDFAKPAAPKPENIDVAELLAELREKWLRQTGWPGDAIQLERSEGTLRVSADRGQLASVLDELFSNAADAMQRRVPQLKINCRLEPADGMVVIAVRDNGCGMTAEVLERALDPFFSHREAGRKRGLGLPRAFRWLEINHGQLRLESAAGAGTVAYVSLPALGDD